MLKILTDRRVLLSVGAIGGLIVVALWPRAVSVEVTNVSRGPLVVTVDEEGMARVRHRFVVTAPVTGRILRIELQPGDRVRHGDVVARLQPATPPLLDARTRSEALAAVRRAEAALGSAQAEAQRAREALAHAQRELARSRRLTAAGATAVQTLEAHEADASVAAATADAAAFAVRAAAEELAQARVRIAPELSGASDVVVRAPADGVVLHRLRESEGVVPAGEPLVEIGDPRQLEIVTDLLSTDAVQVRPGAPAMIEEWGGNTTLHATVRRIEPAGFTKVSALGVDEQRVNVILDLASAEACEQLGDAYRVSARIVLWEGHDVLRVPTNALVRDGDGWAVYAVVGGRARRTTVTLGARTGQEAEVVDGLADGAAVISHPGDRVVDGVRVAASSPGR
jgi:HlyD family secretion protein